MKTIGIMILIAVACFWAGRLTGRPEVVKETKVIKETTYIPPACLSAVCESLYPCPLDNKEAGQ